MRNKALACVVAICSFLPAAIAGQDKPGLYTHIPIPRDTDPTLPQLRQGKLTEVPSLMAMPLVPEFIKRAGDNGVLVVYEGESGGVRYLSFDGQRTVRYDLNLVPQDMTNPFRNFSDVTSDGSVVYVLWNWNPDPHQARAICTLSSYDLADGHYRGTIKMDGVFEGCDKIASLGPEQLVLMAQNLDGSPFHGIYQTNGQFVKKLSFPKDIRYVSKDKPKDKYEPLEIVDDLGFSKYSLSTIDNDGEGNLFMIRRSEDSLEDTSIPIVVFSMNRNGEIHRFQLPRPKTKYGSVVAVRASHQHVVVLTSEQNDRSEWVKAVLRVYDATGKLVQEDGYIPQDFGFMLIDWTPERTLFGMQAGNPRAKVKHFGILEALP
jgi:hypothetical protein